MQISPYVIPGIKRQFLPDKKMIQQHDIDFIIDTILRFTGINRSQMMGRKRDRQIVYSRHLICYFLREKTNLTLKRIGELVGDKDHTTAMSSLRQIKNLAWSDPDVAQDILNIKQLI